MSDGYTVLPELPVIYTPEEWQQQTKRSAYGVSEGLQTLRYKAENTARTGVKNLEAISTAIDNWKRAGDEALRVADVNALEQKVDTAIPLANGMISKLATPSGPSAPFISTYRPREVRDSTTAVRGMRFDDDPPNAAQPTPNRRAGRTFEPSTAAGPSTTAPRQSDTRGESYGQSERKETQQPNYLVLNGPVNMSGFVTPFGTAAPDFTALFFSAVPEVLVVNWPQAGTTAAFTGLSAAMQ